MLLSSKKRYEYVKKIASFFCIFSDYFCNNSGHALFQAVLQNKKSLKVGIYEFQALVLYHLPNQSNLLSCLPLMADKTANQKQISDPEKWVELHGDYLFRYAMMRLNNQSLAEDVVQETFLAALKARKNFAGQSSERTWFVGILKRKIIDHFRKSSREDSHDDIQKIIDMQDDDFLLSGSRRGQWKTGRRPRDWMIDENDQTEKNEFWEFLKRCIAELPRRLAEVFILREMEEIETDELSNVLELKPTNLRVILYRARKQLRSCLEDNWIRSHKDRK